METFKVNNLVKIGDLDTGYLDVSGTGLGHIGRINFSIPSALAGLPMSECKPHKKSAEEMLKKALEYANQGMDEHKDYVDYEDGYMEGKHMAYEDMAAHLEMLIKEAKQNG